MAQPVLKIQFPSPASPDLVHRALNFVEDVYRGANSQNIGSVDDINHYGSGIFLVQVSSTRHFGEMRLLISKLLKRHMLEAEAVVVRGGGE